MGIKSFFKKLFSSPSSDSKIDALTASLDASYSQQVGETEVEIKNQLETLEKQYAKEKYEYEKLISK